MSPWEIGAMEEEEIGAAVQEEALAALIARIKKINDDLYSALSSYKLQVTAGRWLAPGVGTLIYAADDVPHATWEVENWHTGALKWMTEGADMVRKGKIQIEAWAKLGDTFAKNAAEMLKRLRSADAATRAKEFASAYPAALKKTVQAAASGLKDNVISPVVSGLPWWVIGIGAVIAFVAVSGAVSDAARAIKGE